MRSHRRLPRRSIPRPCHSSSRNRSTRIMQVLTPTDRGRRCPSQGRFKDDPCGSEQETGRDHRGMSSARSWRSATKRGVIESDEKKMIYNVFDFGDSVAKDIMVPRIDMTFLDVECQLSGDHGYFPTGEVYEISGL